MEKECKKCGVKKPANQDFFEVYNKKTGGLRGTCIECRKEYRQSYYKEYNEKNRDYVRKRNREYSREWYNNLSKEKIEEINKRSKMYYHKNNKKYRTYYRGYYEKNRTYYRDYYEKNRTKILESKKKYRIDNPEKARFTTKKAKHKRRKIFQELPHTLTLKEWEETLQHFNNECAYCGGTEGTLQQEHVIPLSKGGYYIKQNIIPACYRCNSSKHNRELLDWYSDKSYYSLKRLNKIAKWTGLDLKTNTQQLSIL